MPVRKSQLVLAHEFGHSLGAQHDEVTDDWEVYMYFSYILLQINCNSGIYVSENIPMIILIQRFLFFPGRTTNGTWNTKIRV